ncbi:MAG: hypothetical protein IJE10_10775 [Clostridia bacterium]|nr:hypothetical protein [Clostridia bacterium]
MYYGLIILSVVMFGACFAFQDVYRKRQGSGFLVSMRFSAVSSFMSLLALLIINKLSLGCTGFTLLMAFLTALNSLAFSFCSFKALGSINLSLYSLFSMLGGMALPFLQGILFYGEPLTGAKVICFVIICVALLVTVEKGEKKNGTIYYVGVFVLNGMSGVLSKIFASAELAKASATDYSIWSCIFTVVLAGLVVLFSKRKAELPKLTLPTLGISALSGITNRVANLILVIALTHVDASVQYPMVTGGVMIVSTLICFFGDNKPSKKEVLSVAIAFIGMLVLFLPF